jgi:ELWxxDGT repeat protein
LARFNNILFFTADDGIHGRELWKSDGTPAGTLMLKDITPGPESSAPIALTDANGTLFFATSSAGVARQLWKSDGTAASTVLIKDIPPDPLGVGLASLISVQGQVFYIAGDGGQGYALWRSDGSAGGTVLLKQTEITQLQSAGSNVLFAHDDGIHGLELWKSDGTIEGTTQVADIAAGPASSLTYYKYKRSAPSGAGIVFAASNGTNGMELWQSNGDDAATLLVQDIAPGAGSADPGGLTVVGSRLFFMADDNLHGRELWVMPLPQILPPRPKVSIDGLATGIVERSNRLTAAIRPITDTLPITYVWQADQQPSVTHTGGLTDSVSFTWSTPGTRTITVTASNSAGSLGSDTHTIAIAAPQITPSSGGVVTLPGLTITFPPDSVAAPINLVYAPLDKPTHALGNKQLAVRAFTLQARDLNDQPVTQFLKPYTLVLSYTEQELAALGIAEAELNLAFWNGSAWVNVLPCAGCGVDTINNRLTAVLDHFTEFALFGQAAGDGKIRVYLPMAQR